MSRKTDAPLRPEEGPPAHLKYLLAQIASDNAWRLEARMWYNDEIMCTMLPAWVHAVEKAYDRPVGDTLVYSTFFAQKLMMEGVQKVKRWIKGPELFQKQRLVIPLNLRRNHWAVVVVDNPAGYLKRLAPDMQVNLVPTRTLPYTSEAAHQEISAEQAYQAEATTAQSGRLREAAPDEPWPVDRRAPILNGSPKLFLMDSLVGPISWDNICKRISFYLYEMAKTVDETPPGSYSFVGLPLDIPRWKIQVPEQPNLFDCGPYMFYNVQQFLIHRDGIVTRCIQRSIQSLQDIFKESEGGKMRQTVQTAIRQLRTDHPKGACVYQRVDKGLLNNIINPTSSSSG